MTFFKQDDFSGLYNPDSMVWQINRELALFLTGTRALLLEIAHPLVAAGVAEHSNFKQRPLGRLTRTVRVMQQLSFGHAHDAQDAARHVNHCHRQVAGTLKETTGIFAKETPYDANDPELRLWVFATLIDSILLGYDTFVKPLSIKEKAQYYSESKSMGRMFGLTSQTLPSTYNHFATYVDDVITNGTLAVGPTALNIKEALFHHPTVGWLARIGSFASIGLLPPHIRDAFGFTWDQKREMRLRQMGKISHLIHQTLPDGTIAHPQTWFRQYQWHKKEHTSKKDNTHL